ncbi:hypothetical protein M441DRAFT_58489 [Trichoderma asperellum CBS 433.97]|uniref:Uncharacterized protein n=1 Tax=Trichoderma asperellum (strain ATCC 204424 / CBS 433.97 / NBRC 101777) TaxID=1042311 RepID=A0A2T3Z8B8_TRIA4|nr:hypothetical protein M441DRAFT_58489 [Trichoderma asperellum CBS 433.97]PTB41048.1 hypothetical protein M441DRAFT_58489 [Trichoderma asperellum CBS 433.97]
MQKRAIPRFSFLVKIIKRPRQDHKALLLLTPPPPPLPWLLFHDENFSSLFPLYPFLLLACKLLEQPGRCS